MFLFGLLPFALPALAAPAADIFSNPIDTFPDHLLAIPKIDAVFDYVVVGGGTAGVAIAARLAEQRYHVALVEAGGIYETRSLTAKIPGGDSIGVGSDITSSTSIDWKFVTYNVPGANYRDVHYPRGKCLGGSYVQVQLAMNETDRARSALNFMIYQRPTIQSMQLWADLIQDQSYTFDSVLPYFQKTVDFTPPNKRLRDCNASVQYEENTFDDYGHPLPVTYPNYAMSFSSWMKRGLESIGIYETKDFNSGSLDGSQYCTSTIRSSDQTRSSAESAFFRSSSTKRLRTLKICKDTLAKRVLFNSEKRATGVEVQTGLVTYTLSAKQEIIVSAGVFQSPQLLMVSGIGPADVLKEHEIGVISNLPGVGQNMWDHVFFGPTYQVALETFTKLATDPVFLIGEILRYATTHTGMFTSPVTDYLAFEKFPQSSRATFSARTQEELAWFPDDWPEVEYLSASAYVGDFSHPLISQPKGGPQYASIIASLQTPTSRGNGTIASPDTEDPPVINVNWLSTEADQQLAIAAYKRVRDIFHSKPMASIVIGDEYFPGQSHSTDAEVLDVIRSTVMTIYHAACTCKMGAPNDDMAVLDSHARVFGVDGLRVVDASSFPILVPGHPQSTVYMLAEKIASNIVSLVGDRA